jgi:hypothetical protein
MKKAAIGSDDDRKALADLIALPLSKDVNTVSASGHSEPAPLKAGAKPAPTPARGHGVSATVGNALANLGWSVIGFDDGADALTKQLKDFVAVYNRKGLRAPLKKALGKDDAYLPAIKVTAAPASLGKGAFEVEIKLDLPDDAPLAFTDEGDDGAPRKGKAKPAKPAKAAKTTMTLHILLAVDGKGAWVGFGTNRDDVIKHLLMSKSGAPDADTIASRPGLEPLKNGKSISAGFLTLTTFLHAVDNALSGEMATSPTELAMMKRVLTQIPHKGETPIFLTTTATAGAAPRVEMKVEMTKGSFEDLGAMVRQGMDAFQSGKP